MRSRNRYVVISILETTISILETVAFFCIGSKYMKGLIFMISHIITPKTPAVCDECGGELYQRDDDKQESILHRMDVYREQTEPLIGFYREKGKITDLDASIETDILLGKFQEIFK